MATAEYQVLVNWDQPQDQIVSTFELGLDGWTPAVGIQLDRDSKYVHSGAFSMAAQTLESQELIFDDPTYGFDTFKFGTGVSPTTGNIATKVINNLQPGMVYAAYCWAYIPTGSYHIKLSSTSFNYETSTTENDTWLYLETAFTAVASTHTISLIAIPTDIVTPTEMPRVDDVAVKLRGDDITCQILGNRSSIELSEGRDIPRALAAIVPSQASFEMLNTNRLYTPNNPASILYNKSATNSPIQVRAIFEGRYYILYNGFIDDFKIHNELPNFSTIEISSFDVLGKMASTDISTGLYQNIRTGQAIGYILDEIDWPEGKRKLDYGSTVLDWWWEDDTNALDAIKHMISAEGLPAIAYVDDVGDFVFRDRHHRYISPESLHPVAFFECQDGLIADTP